MDELARSWGRAWGGIGAAGDGAHVFDALIAAHREPARRYHTIQHLGECLALLAANRGLAARPPEVEMGLWFHDAVYEPRRPDNEARSADWARSASLDGGAPALVADRIRSLVLATRHAEPPVGPDAQLIVDIDLAILGSPGPRFAEYERQVREEYAHVPDAAFRSGRNRILMSFLDRDRIFATPRFHAEFESKARENLARSIARGDP